MQQFALVGRDMNWRQSGRCARLQCGLQCSIGPDEQIGEVAVNGVPLLLTHMQWFCGTTPVWEVSALPLVLDGFLNPSSNEDSNRNIAPQQATRQANDG